MLPRTMGMERFLRGFGRGGGGGGEEELLGLGGGGGALRVGFLPGRYGLAE